MGFYEIGNGCDSCDTISSAIPNNVNMQMDANSGLVANMAYGAQANTVQHYNNTISSSGYAQQGNNMGSMGNGSNGSTMGVPKQPTQPKQVVKQVVTTTTTMQPSATPSPPVASPQLNNANNVEGFESMHGSGMMYNDKKWIVLGLVIFTALASNECCKYFLNKSLQLNDGSPMYYIAYVGVAILLTMAANKYSSSA